MKLLNRIFDGLAGLLIRLRVTANHATYAGLAFSFFAALLIVKAHFVLAWGCLALSGLCDVLDGRMARMLNTTGRFGALLDSALDRYSDALFLGAIAMYFFQRIDTLYMWLAISAMIGSFEISYIRARSEGLGESCKVGFWERGERTVLIGLGLLLNNLHLTVVYLGLLTHWTAWERLHFVNQKLALNPENKRAFELKTAQNNRRGGLAHGVQAAILVMTLCFLRF